MADKELPRIPLSSSFKLGPNEASDLQVNFCKNSSCDNFGIPAKETHAPPGPHPDRDQHYKITSTAKGQIPALQCKCCGEKIPIKSNNGIVSELNRISEPLLSSTEKLACKTESCDNYGLMLGENPTLYWKSGRQSVTKDQLYRCKCCKARVVDSSPVRLHKKTQHLASDIFSRVVNKSPVRGTMRGLDISAKTYYDHIKFITRQCNHLSGMVDRKFMEGELTLPNTLRLSVDVQEYQLNWTNKHDKRNAKFSTVCSVDQDTRFIFGMHANYDKEADAFAINKQAALNSEAFKPEAFREYAQYWLACDEFISGRAMERKLGKAKAASILHEIDAIYRGAQTREDIENREDQTIDTRYCNPAFSEGMQVHIPYTAYAHFHLMQQIIQGAKVDNLQVYMDTDSMLRAGFMSAFHQEIKDHKAHGFYVRYTKYLTVPQKTKRYLKTQEALADFRENLPPHLQKDAELLLMQENINHAESIGKWKDKWILHPIPSMNQPEKAICWLTESVDNTMDESEVAQLHLDAGINAVDNVFQISRRLMNAFERPIGTSSGYNTVWHGYAPYNPKMVEQYLSLLRTYHNFIKVGDDKQTPAMRLGITKKPLSFDDVLWPGQKIPKAPRTQRKGVRIDKGMGM